MKTNRYLYMLLAASALLALSSCYRDEIFEPVEYEEGLATRISLRIGVPERSIATRADMPDGMDDEVRSLWVGIFNANEPYQCTFANLYEGDEVPAELQSEHGGFANLTIDTVSGLSYIVAVANPVNNYCYRFSASETSSGEMLSNVLPRSADTEFTWLDYKKLAIRQLTLGDVNTPINNLVMSGIYYGSEGDPLTANDWENANDTPVNILPNGKLSGAVHLRRLISQVKFNIWAVDYSKDSNDGDYNQHKGALIENEEGTYRTRRIVEIIPQSFQVRNVPYTSWLHERKSPDSDPFAPNPDPEKVANSGDVIKLRSSSINYTDASLPLKANYRNSAWFNGSQYLEPKAITTSDGTEVQGFSFDFWMLENKRWSAYDLGGNYDLREKEIKGAKNEYDVTENSGIYTALCGSDGSEIMNNCASFVEIRCRVIYTEAGLDAIKNEDDYTNVEYRSADAVYTVHLGGMKNNWNDFTHRRNHKYTYNVTVMDIDRIIVEGRTDEEVRPGIEGVVTDVVNPPFDVDCHYAVVNIQMSNIERTGGGIDEGNGNMNTGGTDSDVNGSHGSSKYEKGKFPFRIRYYDETNFARYIDQLNIDEYIYHEGDDEAKKDLEMYWNWIEIRPTTGPDVIADYKPYDYDWDSHPEDRAKGKTFRLNEVQDIDKYAHPMDNSHNPEDVTKKNPMDAEQQWYTVFVNEYVYERTTNENENNWRKYVNLSPRMCWINTLFRSSIDDESTYIRSKYVIRQRSVQSFYAVPDGHNGEDIDAIGMEHTNETFGFNLRWDDITTSYGNYPLDTEGKISHEIKNNNGRHNTLLYLMADPRPDGQQYNTGGRGLSWKEYVDPNHLQVITDINPRFNQQETAYQLQEAPYRNQEPYYLVAAGTYTDGKMLPGGYSDINSKYFLRILDACMNRNRDNNGNGIIDPEEVRWYVPASSEIVDLVIGRNSLETPLLDYGINTALNSPQQHITNQIHQANTRFHYATSNQRALWADEGTTINPESDVLGGDWNLPPLNVRCVRALGTDLSTDLNKDLTPAFTTNAAEADGYPTKIYPTYYEIKNQRDYSPDYMEPHQEMTTLNRLCYYGFEFQKELIEFENRTVRVTVDEADLLPAGYYRDGIQDRDHLYKDASGNPILDPPLDPDWKSEHGNPEWRAGKRFASGQDRGYYKVIPETGPYGSGNSFQGRLCVWADAWTETIRPAGWYMIDYDKYSSTEVDGYVYIDEFWIGGTTHESGWYLPDTSVLYSEKKDGTVWWDAMTIKIDCTAGYYWPDLTSGPQSSPLDASYKKFQEDFGDVWHEGNTAYNLISSSYSPTFVWGYVYANGFWDGSKNTSAGYYAVDFDNSGNSTSVHCNDGFWTGERHNAGYYALDPNRFISEFSDELQNKNMTGLDKVFPRFDNCSVDGETIPAGWYKADESKKGNANQSGYQYYPAWNEGGGKHYDAGWYGVSGTFSPTEKDGYTYLEAITKRYEQGFYEGIPSKYSPTKQDGYGWVQWDQNVETPDFLAGYYANGGEGEYLGTDAPIDPDWLAQNYVYLRAKVDKTSERKKDVTVGTWGGGHLFIYNEGSFVEQHGATLQVANMLCEEKYGRGWRLPNLKESSLIKVAMDNAGVYKTNNTNGNNGSLTYNKDIDPKSGYHVGNFLANTYREFGIRDGSRSDKTGYYTGVYYAEADSEVQPGDWFDVEGGPILGRICCITTDQNRHYYIRCVRDLKEGE